MKRILWRLLLLVPFLSCAGLGQEDVVMKAMRDELSRSIGQLRLAELDKPYYIAYRVDDKFTAKVSATLGQLTDKDVDRKRVLGVQLRVGDFALDNTNFMALSSASFGGGNCGCHTTLPLDDDYEHIRHEIWLETDAEYKEAAGKLAAKRALLRDRERGKELPDFIPQASATVSERPVDLSGGIPELEKLTRELSALFNNSPEILSSGVDIYVMSNYMRFVNSEGTSFTRAEPIVILDVRAYTQAKDGQPLWEGLRTYYRSYAELHGANLVSRTRDMIGRVKALRVASSLERYNGPVLFEGEAAGEVVAQIFAPAIVASRYPVTDQPQFETQFRQILDQFGGSLADRLGARVMPEGFDLTDNPRLERFGNIALLGSYQIDYEGVPSREIKLVEGGKLTNLLATRTPTVHTKASTGSDRGMGPAPGNLLLTASQAVTKEQLRKELLRVARQRGYEYGIVVRNTGAAGISSFMRMVMSSMGRDVAGGVAVYKVFADGHEELVRADISPIPLSAFKDILAAGDDPAVYHNAFVPVAGSLLSRFGGSGGRNFVVTSFIVPSILFEEVTLKQPAGTAAKPPLLASPLAAANMAKAR
jgi:hypothetical protein